MLVSFLQQRDTNALVRHIEINVLALKPRLPNNPEVRAAKVNTSHNRSAVVPAVIRLLKCRRLNVEDRLSVANLVADRWWRVAWVVAEENGCAAWEILLDSLEAESVEERSDLGWWTDDLGCLLAGIDILAGSGGFGAYARSLCHCPGETSRSEAAV